MEDLKKLSYTTIDDVKDMINIEDEDKLIKVTERHPMRITDYYFNLINKDDMNDPIRKLSVPSCSELDMSGEYDTSGESSNTKFSGLQHKYSTTVLVLTTNECFMYCRHCFRKRMVGYSQEEINMRLDMTVDYIKTHENVNNVLLTGGDSFCLSNNIIKEYVNRLAEIDHLDFIRFGTRSPVVFPQRIYNDKILLSILKEAGKKKRIYVVTHFDHPNEITPESEKAVKALLDVGVIVQNQAVLLKGVNDNPDVLAALLNGLVKIGVNPYYVFQCRPVKSVKASFELPLIESLRIIDETKKQLNGLSKRFKFIMSHVKGKIEIVGECDDKLIFKFHQSKCEDDFNKIFIKDINTGAKWLDADLNYID
ncbi:MAG: KamA family radical SAM protein [Clostridiaceae bacterium]